MKKIKFFRLRLGPLSYTNNMKIKQCDPDQRPREKAWRFGMKTLSDQEIVCLLLGTGTKTRDVTQIAHDLLKESENLSRLANLSLKELTALSGIGQAKALQIQAAFELTRRALKAKTYALPIRKSQDVVEWLQAEYGCQPQEHFVVLFLDVKNGLICHKVLFIGTSHQSLVDPKEIFREAYLVNANQVLFIHNHPSNDPIPSLADIELTQALEEIAKVCQIPIMDHVIVSRSSAFSFRDHGLLE